MIRTFFILVGVAPTAVCIMLATNTWPWWDIPAGGVFLSVAIVLGSMIGALGITEPRRHRDNYQPGAWALLVWIALVAIDAGILYARFGLDHFLKNSAPAPPQITLITRGHGT